MQTKQKKNNKDAYILTYLIFSFFDLVGFYDTATQLGYMASSTGEKVAGSTRHLSPRNKVRSAKLLVWFNFHSASMALKVVKMLFKCQTAWIWVRRRVTRRLIQIQVACIWKQSRKWQAKG